MSYEKVLELPEETKDQLRDKVNCLIAEEYHLRDKMKESDMQIGLIRKHNERLMKKMKDIILLSAGVV